MSINNISKNITKWCNKKRKITYIENTVIEYELESFLENIIKLIFLIILGFIVHRGIDTLIFITIFCTLRYHAGGFHMKTNMGCMFIMTIIWALSLGIGGNVKISNIAYIMIYSLICMIFIYFVPADFSNMRIICLSEKKKKKIISLLIVTFFFFIGIIINNHIIKGVIIITICLETISILPIFKKGEKHNEDKE